MNHLWREFYSKILYWAIIIIIIIIIIITIIICDRYPTTERLSFSL
jgi:hypothetical protein